MATIRLKRGTRSEITAAASSNDLLQAEPYFVTDENRVLVGTGANTTIELATGPKITVSDTPPGSPRINDIWVDISSTTPP